MSSPEQVKDALEHHDPATELKKLKQYILNDLAQDNYNIVKDDVLWNSYKDTALKNTEAKQSRDAYITRMGDHPNDPGYRIAKLQAITDDIFCTQSKCNDSHGNDTTIILRPVKVDGILGPNSLRNIKDLVPNFNGIIDQTTIDALLQLANPKATPTPKSKPKPTPKPNDENEQPTPSPYKFKYEKITNPNLKTNILKDALKIDTAYNNSFPIHKNNLNDDIIASGGISLFYNKNKIKKRTNLRDSKPRLSSDDTIIMKKTKTGRTFDAPMSTVTGSTISGSCTVRLIEQRSGDYLTGYKIKLTSKET